MVFSCTQSCLYVAEEIVNVYLNQGLKSACLKH